MEKQKFYENDKAIQTGDGQVNISQLTIGKVARIRIMQSPYAHRSGLYGHITGFALNAMGEIIIRLQVPTYNKETYTPDNETIDIHPSNLEFFV